jgi:cytochrome c oxidase subunit 4
MSNHEASHDYPQPFLGLTPRAVEAPHAHVLPKWVYFAVLGALLFLTVVTVATAQIDLGVFNLPLAMAIAGTKATLVAAIFMHLWWDHKFNLALFLSSLLFLAIFVVLTMLDTQGRDIVDHQRANFLPRDEMVEVAPGGVMHPGQPFGAAGWDANKKVFDEKHPHHEAAAGHHEAPAHH